MEKVLVEVYVPLLNEAYDVFLPLQSQMSEVLELLKQVVKELSEGRFVGDGGTAICHRADGSIINLNMSVFELGIRNGSRLMLI